MPTYAPALLADLRAEVRTEASAAAKAVTTVVPRANVRRLCLAVIEFLPTTRKD